MKPFSGTAGWKKEIFPTLLLMLLAVAFLLSAISKYTSIDSFSWTLLDAGVPGDRLSAFLARLLVGLEAACGLLFLLRIRVRKLALPLSVFLLLVFSGYLFYLLAAQGNAGDCGCFGDWLPMKPLPALLKNAGLVLAALLLYRLQGWREWKIPSAAAWIVTAAITVLPVVLLPVSTKKEKLAVEVLEDKSIVLGKRKELIAFLSLGCPHCRTAATKFAGFYRENPSLPIVLVLNDSNEDSQEFLTETGSQQVPRLHETDMAQFQKLAGKYVPSVYFVHNGMIERRVSYNTLTRAALERWLSHP